MVLVVEMEEIKKKIQKKPLWCSFAPLLLPIFFIANVSERTCSWQLNNESMGGG